MRRRLSAYPFKEKHEILDWSKISGKRCDMNFRLPVGHPGKRRGQAILLLVVASIFASACWLFFRSILGAYLGGEETVLAATITGMLLAVPILFGWYRPLPNLRIPGIQTGIVLATMAIPPLLCLGANTVFRGDAAVISYRMLAFLAVPLIAVCADQMATQYIYWMTAHPKIDRKTMTHWRRQWDNRFAVLKPRWLAENVDGLQQSELEMSTRFCWTFVEGLGLVAFGLLIPPVVVMGLYAAGADFDHGTAIVGLQVLTLLLLAMLRIGSTKNSWRVFQDALEHWLTYARNRRIPPWVFQSPGGRQFLRLFLAWLTIGTLAFCMIPLLYAFGPEIHAHVDSSADLLGARWHDIWELKIAPAISELAAGDFRSVGSLLGTVVVAALLPTGVFCLATAAITAPLLVLHYKALEAPGAAKQHEDWDAFDGYTERLRNSRNELERNSLLVGFHSQLQFPILLDRKLLFEHMLILGATGGGKSVLGVCTKMIQLIRMNHGPVVVVDLKGDPALFHTARTEAAAAGRRFKHFTTLPEHSTYVFNPFGQDYLSNLTLTDFVGLFMNSLNLSHGSDYGRAFFAMIAWATFRAATRSHAKNATPPNCGFGSFTEAEEELRRVVANEDEFRQASHLVYLIQALSEFEQLNLSALDDPEHSAIRNAINMSEVIEEKQVVYFYLVGAIDSSIGGEIARLVMYSVLMAAIYHRKKTGKAPEITFICDEAQMLVAKNIENVLAQARSHGVACTFANQTLSQYNPPGGLDLRELILSCTCTKQIFTARDPGEKKLLSEMSGQVGYYSAGWTQRTTDVLEGNIGREHAVGFDQEPSCSMQQEIGPRLLAEDIDDISRHESQSILMIQRNSNLSQYLGAFAVDTHWPMCEDEYKRRTYEMPWPVRTDETIEVGTFWPTGDSGTIVAKKAPAGGRHTPEQTSQFLRGLLDKHEEK